MNFDIVQRLVSAIGIWLSFAALGWAQIPLRQSTPVTIKLGPFVDESDGHTPESGLTILQADVRLSKNGENIDQKNESSSATYDEVGVYDVDLNATDTGTLGVLNIFVNEGGALPVFRTYVVLPSNVYDSLYGSDKLEVDAVQFIGVAVGSATVNANTTQVNGSSTAATQLAEAFDNDSVGGDLDITQLKVTEGAYITQSTSGQPGPAIVGSGAGPGILVAGSSSHGVLVLGGTTGDGIRVTTTDGDALSLSGTGSDKHGIKASGGSGSGTGISGNITGNILGNLTGSVGSVTSDVGGKVLGGGSGTISGTGVRAVDGSGNAIAPASTALSTAQWTNTRAGYLDNLSGGAVATQSSVNSIDGIVDNIFTAFEADGGVYRLTTNALEQLATDWSATEKDQIRHRLGLDGTTSTPSAVPSLGPVNANVTSMANNVMTASAADSSLGTELGTATWVSDGRTLSGTTNDFDELLDGAPTFADAMDEHGYTTGRAEIIDRLAPSLLLSSTIDDTSVEITQTSFALASGPTDDDALKGALIIVTGASDTKAVGLVKKYNGTNKTVTLVTDPEIFEFADGDQVDVIATGSPAALWLGGSP